MNQAMSYQSILSPCSPNLTPFSYQAQGRALAPSSSSSYNLRSQGPAELGAEVLDKKISCSQKTRTEKQEKLKTHLFIH